MITSQDVSEFLQKRADATMPDPTDAKPAVSATGAPGFGGRMVGGIGRYIKKSPIPAAFAGLGLYGLGSDVVGSYGKYDEDKALQAQYGQYAQSINTLEKDNPFLVNQTQRKTPYQKDMNEYGLSEANFRNAERMDSEQKANDFDKKMRAGKDYTSQEDVPLGKRDYTMTGQFQQANNTKTVPVTAKRYERG